MSIPVPAAGGAVYLTGAACVADFNGDGDLSADDLGDILTALFSGCR